MAEVAPTLVPRLGDDSTALADADSSDKGWTAVLITEGSVSCVTEFVSCDSKDK